MYKNVFNLIKNVFRAYHSIEDSQKCTEENYDNSQLEFQQCIHSISSHLNDVMADLTDSRIIHDTLCEAVNNVTSDCIPYLAKCLDPEDLKVLSKSHMDNLQKLFENIVGEKLDQPFFPDNCSNKSKVGVQDNGDIKNNENISGANLEYSMDSSENDIPPEPESRNLVNKNDDSTRSEIVSQSIETQSKEKFTSTTVSNSNNIFRDDFIHVMIVFVNCLITLYLF